MMKRVLAGIIIVLLVITFAYAQDRGTASEAKALLDKAVAYYKANGQEKAFAAFNDPNGGFIKGERFVGLGDVLHFFFEFINEGRLAGR